MDDELNNAYYDPSNSASLGGLYRLWRQVDPSKRLSDVNEWSKSQEAYTLHKQSRQKFPRRITEVGGEDQQLQADLMDIRNHRTFNDDYAFILTCVDVFSKRAWAIPIKNKTGERVREALSKVLQNSKFTHVQTDKGKEFYNERVGDLFKYQNITHFSSEDDSIKASLVERFNRTLRGKIHRFMTANRSKRFVHKLQDFVNAYNSTPHSSTGESPINVGPHNREEINQRLYLPWREASSASETIGVGDYVRMVSYRGTFKRGYTANWTTELFKVIDKDSQTQPPTFTVEDLSGEIIKGSFYGEELQVVDKPETFSVDEVLRTRRVGRKKQFYVKWNGYPESFNSWVDEVDMI